MTVPLADEWLYLSSFLAPLVPVLARTDVTDIYINRAGELWLETQAGASERHDMATLDDAMLMRIARQIAALNDQAISREHPLLSASLPDGSRIQIIAPPATRGSLALAIRKHAVSNPSLDDYTRWGAFRTVRTGGDAIRPTVQAVSALLDAGKIAEALREAVLGKMNILISGGTSSGKTTFMGALMREIPERERLILIEDTPELRLGHDNAVGLLAARSPLAEAAVTANDLVSAALRMRPDRIILGELRGPEALAFLRAVNSGHPGSMTTVHADSVDGAVEQLALLVLEAGTTLGRPDILHYVDYSIDLLVQLERADGGRRVSECRLGRRHRAQV